MQRTFKLHTGGEAATFLPVTIGVLYLPSPELEYEIHKIDFFSLNSISSSDNASKSQRTES